MIDDRAIRVLISDDRLSDVDYYVEKLSRYPDIDVVGTARYPDEMLRQLLDLKPDVVLFDLYYDGWADQEAVFDIVREARQRNPDVVIIAHTAYFNDERRLPERALAAGCAATLPKSGVVGYQQVHDRIVTLARRDRDRRLNWAMVGATDAEIEVFLGRVQGRPRDEIARLRGERSERTIKSQELSCRDRIAALTGEEIEDMTQATAIALRTHLIEPRHITDRSWPPKP
jgi:DNA-binding NarL/FixJ family response regulator